MGTLIRYGARKGAPTLPYSALATRVRQVIGEANAPRGSTSADDVCSMYGVDTHSTHKTFLPASELNSPLDYMRQA